MRTQLIPDRLLDLIKRNAVAFTAARAIRMQVGRLMPPRVVPGIPGRVHFNDFMFESDSDEDALGGYLGDAEDVMQLLEDGLSRSGRSFAELRTVLDFGSGYGRVVRLLVNRVEPSRVFVTDLDHDSVAFCASEFGVNPIFPRRDGGIPVLPPMDLIYAISVLTHLPAARGIDALQAWSRSVEPSGVLLFTTHGPATVDDPARYGIPSSRRQELKGQLEADGFAYASYDHYLGDDYGIAWHTPEHVAELAAKFLPEFEQVAYLPQGHVGHHDVFVYRREG